MLMAMFRVWLHHQDIDPQKCNPVQEENEEEEELLDNLAACLTAVLRTYGDSAITLMDGLMPKLGLLLDASRSTEERRVGICIVDDILEHSAACEYQPSACAELVQAHSLHRLNRLDFSFA
jgi:importin-5